LAIEGVEKNWPQEKGDECSDHCSSLAERDLVNLVGAASYDLSLYKTYAGPEDCAAYSNRGNAQQPDQK
jgi:hypothetical protein